MHQPSKGPPKHAIQNRLFAMEPTTGIEPVNLFLTTEALYRLSYVGNELTTA